MPPSADPEGDAPAGAGASQANNSMSNASDGAAAAEQQSTVEDELAEMEAQNPFRLPSDEEVFRMRDVERQRKANAKRQAGRLRVWEKTTASGRVGASRRFQSRRQREGADGQSSGLVAAATAAISNDRRREKENMADFIAKKREMFLVQMSLDTKREEIRKLEEKAQMKEEALKKSELMLEEDAIRFDTFLKENDKKAHEAIKRAEKETKAKTDKVQEIKRLNQQIQMINSDMSKLKEQLDDCQKYKTFLDQLTPTEWFEQQNEVKRQRKDERRQKRNAELLAAWEEAKAKAIAEAAAREQAEKEALEKQGKVKKKGERSRAAKVELPPMPELLNEGDVSSSGEEIPMYFTHPQQLLDIFTALEESNLFLIQNSQETEQQLEELKQNFRETKRRMDDQTQRLQQQIEDLQGQIAAEEAKAEALRRRSEASTGEDKQEELLVNLNASVKDVYRRCGFDADSNPKTLFMLSELEARLEDLLSAIEAMPEEYVTKAEKDKEKDRRERVRQERMAQQQKVYEERMRKSMERSMQAPRKRKGRQVMWRSKPIRRAVRTERQEDEQVDDDADAKYFQ